jgi:type II secretory pathway component PulF
LIRFAYTAHSGKGQWVSGTVRATSEKDARRYLLSRGLEPTSVEVYRGWNSWNARLALLSPVDFSQLTLATRQFAVLLNSGIDVVRSLEVLMAADYGRRLNLAWLDVSRALQRGVSLSKALGRHPVVFSPVYRGLVKAGEESGGLVLNLNSLADHLEKDLRLRHKLKAALIYPAFVFVICLLALLLLTQKVLPTLISGVFRESGMELPWITRSVVWVGQLLNSSWFLRAGVPIFLLGALMLQAYALTPGGRYRWQWCLWHTPGLRSLWSSTCAARFGRSMSALCACGMPWLRSLELTAQVVDDYRMRGAIDQLILGVEEGEPIAEVMRQNGAFPALVVGFTELGQETGGVAKAYRHLSDMLEEEIELNLNTVTTTLEPLMVGLMGLFVGYVVIALFLPLYSILNGAT